MSSPRLIATSMRELLPMYRAPGNHVSEIITRLAISQGLLDDRSEEDEVDENKQFMFELGSAWEDVVAAAIARRYALDQPGRYVHGLELSKDGITGNLDLFDLNDLVVEEVKLTAMSLNRAEDVEGKKFWRYWRQTQSYIIMVRDLLGVHCDTGRLHVGFYRGDYKEILVAYRCWEWRWEERELVNNWHMMVGNKLR